MHRMMLFLNRPEMAPSQENREKSNAFRKVALKLVQLKQKLCRLQAKPQSSEKGLPDQESDSGRGRG